MEQSEYLINQLGIGAGENHSGEFQDLPSEIIQINF